MKKFLLAIMLLFATNVTTMMAELLRSSLIQGLNVLLVLFLKPAMKDVNCNAHITI